MFCKNCGSEISENGRFCKFCGTPVTNPSSSLQLNSESFDSNYNSDNTRNKSYMILGMKLALLIGLICFFFTFMSVSCLGAKANVSGFDMIFGDNDISNQITENAYDDLEYENDYIDESSSEDDGSLFNIFILGSVICAILALILSKKYMCIFSAISSVLLIIFALSAKSYYSINDYTLKELEEYGMVIEFGFAMYLAIIIFAVVPIVYYINEKRIMKYLLKTYE